MKIYSTHIDPYFFKLMIKIKYIFPIKNTIKCKGSSKNMFIKISLKKDI